MPNTAVRAAAEGMPDETRRRTMAMTGAGLMAALAASLAATPAKPDALAAEHPAERINRLARELSEALNHWQEGR